MDDDFRSKTSFDDKWHEVKDKLLEDNFIQPQQKYAGTGENCNILIAVIFYPVNKTF